MFRMVAPVAVAPPPFCNPLAGAGGSGTDAPAAVGADANAASSRRRMFATYDPEEYDAVFATLRLRMSIGDAFVSHSRWLPAEEHYLVVQAATAQMRRGCASVRHHAACNELWCAASVGIGRVALSEAAALSAGPGAHATRDTTEHLCRLALFQCATVKAVAAEAEGGGSAALVAPLHLEGRVFALRGDWRRAVIALQRCSGIAFAAAAKGGPKDGAAAMAAAEAAAAQRAEVRALLVECRRKLDAAGSDNEGDASATQPARCLAPGRVADS